MELIHQVLLSDQGHDLDYHHMRLYFMEAAAWAARHCASYINYEIVDVADLSPIVDQIAEYKFTDERDATLFSLKWSK
jgi:hypothetical protein